MTIKEALAGTLGEKEKHIVPTRETTSNEIANARIQNHAERVKDASWEADIVVRGTFKINLLDHIDLEIICKDGSRHFASGTYLVLSKIDTVEGGVFSSSMKIQKIKDDGNLKIEPIASIYLPDTSISGGTEYQPESLYDERGYKKNTHDERGFEYSKFSSRITTPGSAPVKLSGSGKGVDIVNTAYEYIGRKYVYGGKSLEYGIDCSGFVWKIYGMHGINFSPGTSHTQAKEAALMGTAVSLKDIEPGDFVYYAHGHVGIYAGNGEIINAYSSDPYPQGGVRLSPVGNPSEIWRVV